MVRVAYDIRAGPATSRATLRRRRVRLGRCRAAIAEPDRPLPRIAADLHRQAPRTDTHGLALLDAIRMNTRDASRDLLPWRARSTRDLETARSARPGRRLVAKGVAIRSKLGLKAATRIRRRESKPAPLEVLTRLESRHFNQLRTGAFDDLLRALRL